MPYWPNIPVYRGLQSWLEQNFFSLDFKRRVIYTTFFCQNLTSALISLWLWHCFELWEVHILYTRVKPRIKRLVDFFIKPTFLSLLSNSKLHPKRINSRITNSVNKKIVSLYPSCANLGKMHALQSVLA